MFDRVDYRLTVLGRDVEGIAGNCLAAVLLMKCYGSWFLGAKCLIHPTLSILYSVLECSTIKSCNHQRLAMSGVRHI